MRKSLIMALALVLAVLVITSPGYALAQDVGEQDLPIVYGVVLFSTSCGHCHNLITNDWPPIAEEFGNQLQVLWINVSSEFGNQLGTAIYDYYGIPADQHYVPFMIIGDQYMVGGTEIPARAPEIIRQGLANGGIPLPPVPGLQEAYDQAVANAQQQAEESSQGEEEPVPTETADAESEVEVEATAEPEETPSDAVDVPLDMPDVTNVTVIDLLKRDLAGNILAIFVLLGLVGSLGTLITVSLRADDASLAWLSTSTVEVITLIVALVGVGVSATLLAGSEGGALPLGLVSVSAAGLAAVVAVLLLGLVRKEEASSLTQRNAWLIILALIAGLAAAIYLSYVEVGQETAVCGAVGDCNTVQDSVYAALFGVLPVGVLGVLGYVAIFLGWLVTQLFKGKLADWAWVGIFAMSLFGVAFSAYLTFLEPFVIGATCAWCLTSALVMMLILWLSAEPGISALHRIFEGEDE